MKALSLVGILLLILGVLSLVVSVPHRENHGVKIGDAKISVQTESSDKLPPAAGIVLLAGGVGALILGLRKLKPTPGKTCLFESQFLTPTQDGKDEYQSFVSEAARIVLSALPKASSSGKNATTLADLISTDFLPDAGATSDN